MLKSRVIYILDEPDQMGDNSDNLPPWTENLGSKNNSSVGLSLWHRGVYQNYIPVGFKT